jgi:hypothetical protein
MHDCKLISLHLLAATVSWTSSATWPRLKFAVLIGCCSDLAPAVGGGMFVFAFFCSQYVNKSFAHAPQKLAYAELFCMLAG